MGTPRVSSPVHGIASLPRPSEDPSVRPNTSPGASRDLGSSHSISIGDGAVGPPRSGFVLRLCIRKADGACLKAALHNGLAYTRFCRSRTAEPADIGGGWFLSGRHPKAGMMPVRSRSVPQCATAAKRLPHRQSRAGRVWNIPFRGICKKPQMAPGDTTVGTTPKWIGPSAAAGRRF